MAFRPLKQIPGHDLKRAVYDNVMGSSALTGGIGYVLVPGATGHNAYVESPATPTTGYILGVSLSVIQSGKVSEKATVTGVNSALVGAPSTGPGTDNETYKVWSTSYIPSYIPMEYEADCSSAPATDAQGLCWMALATSATLTPTAILFSGTADQFWSFGVTDYSTTKVTGHFYKTL